ncbi:MAG: cell envelope integrity protein CreD [Ectothiorhodospiraceae bacterium]|nr:cell envelope integrity protein CreD [Ectothiorhodospiraceae bacterium]
MLPSSRVLRESVTAKLLVMGVLGVLLLLPMGLIQGLVDERQWTATRAGEEIMQAWGQQQVIAGPMLVVPYRYRVREESGEIGWRDSRLFVSPSRLAVNGTLQPEIRYRGLHQVPVYAAELGLSGRFEPVDLGSLLPTGAEAQWERAVIALGIADPRPIKEPVVLASGSAVRPFRPGGELLPGLGRFLVADLPPPDEEGAMPFDLRLRLNGSERIAVVPMGEHTRLELAAPWPSPSFEGAYLPDARSVDADGFTARWDVLALGRGFPPAWRLGEVQPQVVLAAAYGVRLYQAAGVYQQTTRAAKYAVLFVVLTFLVYFLAEIFGGRLLHPFQYLLVGLANCVFYLLLLALSEHVDFALAYGVAACACACLVGGYSASVLGSRLRGLGVLVVLGGLYGFLFVVLRSEDTALLMGALAVFAALAVLMFVTRRVDWYALHLGHGRA